MQPSEGWLGTVQRYLHECHVAYVHVASRIVIRRPVSTTPHKQQSSTIWMESPSLHGNLPRPNTCWLSSPCCLFVDFVIVNGSNDYLRCIHTKIAKRIVSGLLSLSPTICGIAPVSTKQTKTRKRWYQTTPHHRRPLSCRLCTYYTSSPSTGSYVVERTVLPFSKHIQLNFCWGSQRFGANSGFNTNHIPLFLLQSPVTRPTCCFIQSGRANEVHKLKDI